IFSIVYPLIVRDEYEWFDAFSMVLISGVGTFIDNFFGIKYKILLQADQKYYIQIGASTVTTILTTVTSIVLITSTSSIHIVRLGITIVSLVNPLLLSVCTRKRYSVDWKAQPDYLAISQRWDAFFHILSHIRNENIDIILISF